MNILVIDIGGTNVKMLATGQSEPRKFPSGPELTPQQLVEGVRANTADWAYDRITIGLPTPILDGKPLREPVNLGPGWVDFDFATGFGKQVKLINDAAMQALGSYEGGRMLFLGLGTGLGSALIIDGVVAPLELGHLPYGKDGSYEDYVGQHGLDQYGKKEWRTYVEDVVNKLREAMVATYVVLGGGNVRKLKTLPPHCKRGDNVNAFHGGFRLWEDRYSLGH
jgi:polyphosphate glucokinase